MSQLWSKSSVSGPHASVCSAATLSSRSNNGAGSEKMEVDLYSMFTLISLHSCATQNMETRSYSHCEPCHLYIQDRDSLVTYVLSFMLWFRPWKFVILKKKTLPASYLRYLHLSHQRMLLFAHILSDHRDLQPNAICKQYKNIIPVTRQTDNFHYLLSKNTNKNLAIILSM